MLNHSLQLNHLRFVIKSNIFSWLTVCALLKDGNVISISLHILMNPPLKLIYIDYKCYRAQFL